MDSDTYAPDGQELPDVYHERGGEMLRLCWLFDAATTPERYEAAKAAKAAAQLPETMGLCVVVHQAVAARRVKRAARLAGQTGRAA